VTIDTRAGAEQTPAVPDKVARRWSNRRSDPAPLLPSRRRDAIEYGVFAVLVIAAVVYTINGSLYRVQTSIDMAALVALVYSWNIISGFTGYISFGQISFFGFGAFATAELVIHAGMPWWVAAPVAGLLSALAAVPLGLIMLRLRGIFFAIGMHGVLNVLGLLAAQWTFTGGGVGLTLPGSLDQSTIFLALTATVLVAAGLNLYMSRSRFGLRAMAVRDDEEAASAMGVRTVRVKVTAFVLSALVPAVVGGLVAYNRSYIDSPSAFSSTMEVQVMLYAIAGGMGTFWGPLLGAVPLQLIGDQLWLNYPGVQLGLFGLLIILIVLFMRGGVISVFNRFGLLNRTIHGPPDPLPSLDELERRRPPAPGEREGHVLDVRGVKVRFGGVHALRGVDLTVQRGEIVCIIGANGAGKTTLFNAITGMVAVSDGTLIFDGEDIGRMPVHTRARRGLGRTFQIPRPFESMTVWENIFLAAASGRRRDEASDQAAWVVRVLGLEDIWLRPVRTLPVGHRRMVELARALALQPELIMLDEVMAGMSHDELERVRRAIREMPRFGVGAVAGIEHVIRAIIDIADRIVVVDEGAIIASGAPREIMEHPDVVRAYLGGEVLAR
jgi:branched-chain amino acid transport system permease protein